jgi:hypothetical protein
MTNGDLNMKLTDIHTQFKTDKGTAHDYIPYYEQMVMLLWRMLIVMNGLHYSTLIVKI